MKTVRRKMTPADWGVTTAGFAVGAFAGLIIGGMMVLLYSGLWMLVILALPLLIFQLLFEGMLAGLVALWHRWRGRPPEAEPLAINPAVGPWLRRYSFNIGFVIGAVYGLATMPPL
ncbi:hypothetical protein WH297_14665 [Ochrobactrum vermis]|uniref:Uncharacterized protein n=1 Tax=Ochrobactrum vermis TaxID=1827297 RepID=A0ABU8PHQ6_9HYPH|nr:hypothetical protein [Ochrobactrum vermis]PQZ25391.1 hypothetical protein CQZ93_14900 [Ochrobactrum vermis]